ncbi:MAG: DUF2300 domain-containing protein, partial [Azoarcus sp.]|nr:DUF2300 domain-containing protein [Azoarcus sp.]
MRKFFILCLIASICLPAQAKQHAVPALEILWRDRPSGELIWRVFDSDGKTVSNLQQPNLSPGEAARRNGEPFAQRAPLGSLWKLFVYAWLAAEGRVAPDYFCTGSPKLRNEEAYCCGAGQGIGQDLALVRSCGLFFNPKRLGISASAWRAFWEAQPGVRTDAPWLADLSAMRPDTVVSPFSIVRALEAVPPRPRENAANILLSRLFTIAPIPDMSTDELVRRLGGQLRVKTFSWHLPGQPGKPYGGGAGWLADGRAVWFAGLGTGQQVLARQGAALGTALAETLAPGDGAMSAGCVQVNFFARYAFEVQRPGGKTAPEGVLRG